MAQQYGYPSQWDPTGSRTLGPKQLTKARGKYDYDCFMPNENQTHMRAGLLLNADVKQQVPSEAKKSKKKNATKTVKVNLLYRMFENLVKDSPAVAVTVDYNEDLPHLNVILRQLKNFASHNDDPFTNDGLFHEWTPVMIFARAVEDVIAYVDAQPKRQNNHMGDTPWWHSYFLNGTDDFVEFMKNAYVWHILVWVRRETRRSGTTKSQAQKQLKPVLEAKLAILTNDYGFNVSVVKNNRVMLGGEAVD